ncbi:hypothetical protein [Acidovorax sp. NCPPB 3576]|uniref:hypothetical protein n=1 Tax=Acidovorax sp. NCPPB 3576 TaxID=2940488 RepID=UPI00234BA43F|nr:hypothetical protein [Acidovorax sp. NCPPB 3576]WCM90650.1 hypothetical protein M5C98_11810 [Acidovorax sp. NCPPB 3576]
MSAGAENEPRWLEYWRENMEALGIPVPATAFPNYALIVGTIKTLVDAARVHGPRVTVGELVVAGTLPERLAMLGALGVAYFAGAAVGSAAVATGRVISGGTGLSDVLFYASRHGFLNPQVGTVLQTHPQIYQRQHAGRLTLALSPQSLSRLR